MNEPNLATVQFFHRMIIVRYRLTRDLALPHGMRFTVLVQYFHFTVQPYRVLQGPIFFFVLPKVRFFVAAAVEEIGP